MEQTIYTASQITLISSLALFIFHNSETLRNNFSTDTQIKIGLTLLSIVVISLMSTIGLVVRNNCINRYIEMNISKSEAIVACDTQAAIRSSSRK